jgi:phenylacetate-CoA ligase
VVVTPLADTGMALFRYRIGDRGRLLPGSCPCGSAARRLRLLGRTERSISVDGKVVSDELLLARLPELGIPEPSDCQLQVRWSGPTYELALLVAPGAAPGLTVERLVAVLSVDYTLGLLVCGPRLAGLRLERSEPAGFGRTARGKVPLLYERRAEAGG